jgi:hypothetical protein
MLLERESDHKILHNVELTCGAIILCLYITPSYKPVDFLYGVPDCASCCFPAPIIEPS